MSREKKVYNLLKMLDNVNAQITFNIFNNNKKKLKSSFNSKIKFLKITLLSTYFFTISYFIYKNYDFFMANNYNISINEGINLVVCILSIILYLLCYDLLKIVINKYFSIKYSKLLEAFKSKEKTELATLVLDYDIQQDINLKTLAEDRLNYYNNMDDEIINRTIKQTSFKTENEQLNELIDKLTT